MRERSLVFYEEGCGLSMKEEFIDAHWEWQLVE